jgi:hypothetical protein
MPAEPWQPPIFINTPLKRMGVRVIFVFPRASGALGKTTTCLTNKGVPLFRMRIKGCNCQHSKAKATGRNIRSRKRKNKAAQAPATPLNAAIQTKAKDLMATLEKYLPKRALTVLARRTQFQRRQPKGLPAWLFLQSACLLVTQTDVSYAAWAMLIGILGGCTLAKQSLHERVTDAAVAFLSAVLEVLIGSMAHLSSTPVQPYLSHFKRVLLEDSTDLSLGEKLATLFPGPRNQHGSCGGMLKIQACWDLIHERFVHFSLSSFRRNDQAAARDILDWIKPGDLLIRDLGYFVVGLLRELELRQAFFLSRLHLNCLLYELDGRTRLDLLARLRRDGSLDEELLLGAEQVRVRVVALPAPPAVAAERRRKARQNRDRRTQPSSRLLALQGWTLLITNVPRKVWSAKIVAQAYGIRWRVETIFKAWKSHFDLRQIPEKASAQEAQAIIYAKLIFILLFEVCFWRPVMMEALLRGWRAPSLLKVSQALVGLLLALVLEEVGVSPAAVWEVLARYYCRYEKRRRPHFLEQVLPVPKG